MLKMTWKSVSGSVVVLAGLVACGGGATTGASSPKLLATSTASCTPAAFGVTAASGYLTVSSGAGLVFKVNQTTGDVTSITYNCGPELQAQDKYSQISSGLSAAATYTVSGTVAKITIATSTLTHYMLVKQNDNTIYMGTYISAEPTVGELRWVTRLNKSIFTGVPAESNLTGNTGAIESTDIYGMADGTTRSKYYGNQAAKDLAIRGVTGSGIGVFMAYGNRESSSGGPFFHDIQNQTGFPETNNAAGDVHVYNYMNSGHNQTEAFRTGFHGPYALVFNDGSTTPAVPDMSWMSTQGLQGWVDATGRGGVSGAGLTGMDPNYTYTVGFANSAAQYWATASSTGSFTAPNMKAGTYTMTVYKGELAVHTEQVTVTAGSTTSLPSRAIDSDPSTATALWRIGDWDGTPLEFMNGTSINVRHPSDSRNASWGPVSYAAGSPSTTFPAAQWINGVNNPTTVTFNLTAAQIANHTIRVGISAAYANGRPQILVNSWSSANPAYSTQPNSRSLTIGTYRGNNAMFTFSVPSSAFVVGSNTLKINVISGSSGTAFLSPGYAYDAVDML